MPRKSAIASGSRRRSTRLGKAEEEGKLASGNNNIDDENENDEGEESDSNSETEGFLFEGKVYATYYEMVLAKRKRNEDILKAKGLLKPLSSWLPAPDNRKKEAVQNGIKRRKKAATEKPTVQRKSKRLAGTPSDGRFVEHEGGGSFVIAGERNGAGNTQTTTASATQQTQERNARVNDGSPLSLQEAVEHCEPKWVLDTSVEAAKSFCSDTLKTLMDTKSVRKNKVSSSSSPTSVVSHDQSDTSIRNQIEQLSVDDVNLVAKVTPDRIYSIAAHPSKETLVVSAGDKLGYVGLWNVDKKTEGAANDGVTLFRFHTRPVNTLDWTSQGLLSSSYDGTVRYFDVAKESFEEIFSSDEQEDNFYTQYLCRDHRSNDHSFFLSTSIGSVMHIDRRIGQSSANVTFHADLSEKKINSVSLHRDGYVMATAGLDRTIKFWDLRKFGGNSRGKIKAPASGALLGESISSLSVNSAFFSPSGAYLVATTMSDTLNIYHNVHVQAMEQSVKKKKSAPKVLPDSVIRHNNKTGRWLTTFMAQWHPELDIFCVGSMQKPRAIDIYDGASGEHLRAIEGDALTAVASRCCFHPSADKMVLVGGNSSGRVTVIRKKH